MRDESFIETLDKEGLKRQAEVQMELNVRERTESIHSSSNTDLRVGMDRNSRRTSTSSAATRGTPSTARSRRQ
jgi:hypothetical protein